MASKKKLDDVIAPTDVTDVEIKPESVFERSWRLVMNDIGKFVAALVVLGGYCFSGWMIATHDKHGLLFTGPFFGILLGAAGYLGYSLKDGKRK